MERRQDRASGSVRELGIIQREGGGCTFRSNQHIHWPLKPSPGIMSILGFAMASALCLRTQPAMVQISVSPSLPQICRVCSTQSLGVASFPIAYTSHRVHNIWWLPERTYSVFSPLIVNCIFISEVGKPLQPTKSLWEINTKINQNSGTLGTRAHCGGGSEAKKFLLNHREHLIGWTSVTKDR